MEEMKLFPRRRALRDIAHCAGGNAAVDQQVDRASRRDPDPYQLLFVTNLATRLPNSRDALV